MYCLIVKMDPSNSSTLSGGNSIQLSTLAMHGPVTESIPLNNGSELDGGNFTDTSSDTLALVLYYNKIRTNIWIYVPPIIITIGVFFNLLSFLIWIRSLVRKRGSSSNYFFACLAIADIVALLFIPSNDHISQAYWNGIDLRKYSDFTCKFYSFMFVFSLSFTSYTLAALALFRMIGTIYPHKYKQICSARNARITIIVIIAFTILAHIQAVFRFRLVDSDGNDPICFDTTDNAIIRIVTALWAMLVVYVVPMFTIVLSNACIVWKLIRRRMQPIGNTSTSQGDHAFSRTITVLIAVSLVYVITMSPMWVYVILRVRSYSRTVGMVELARSQLGWAIVNNVCLLNSAGNFFAYCLTHPLFFQEVKDCFRAFVARIRAAFPMCRKANTVGIINVEEAGLGKAGTSGTHRLTKSTTLSTTVAILETQS